MICDCGIDGMGSHHVRPAYYIRVGFFVKIGEHGTNGNLDSLGSSFTDFQVMLLAHIVLDIGGEHISCDTDTLLLHDTTERDYGDLGCSAADINHHVSLRGLNVKTDTEGSGHRFVNQIHVAASSMFGGVADGPDFNLGTAAGDTDNDLQVRGKDGVPVIVDLLDETADHHLGGVEVGDNAVPQRPYRFDSGVGFLVHQFGFLAECDAFACIVVDCHDARLVKDDFVVLENDGVGGSEIHGKFLGEERKCHFSIIFVKIQNLRIIVNKFFHFAEKNLLLSPRHQYDRMERTVYFIVSAGGSGSRMGAGKPKQFLTIGNKSILHLTIETLHEAVPEARFVTVLSKDHLPYWKQYCLENNLSVPQILVEGGLTRFHSVKAALEKIPDGAIAAIHDGVRPFVSAALVKNMLQKIDEGCRGLVPCLPATDTFKVLRHCEDSLFELVPGAAPVDRQTLFSVQTPQMFLSEEIKQAYSAAYDVAFTDDSSVAAASGIPVKFIPGEKFNIKITTPEDLVLAGAIKADKEKEV